MTLTVTDLFCGAGGSSLGAAATGKVTLAMAANHWQTAIDVHQRHFSDAGHDCADISQVDPRRYPRTDILLASPECTNHSQARGISRKRQDPTLWDAPDPTAERSRATMWDVPRFAEQMHYDAVIVENVVEATKWVLWPAWWQAMEALGYTGRVLSHNSMHHGVPQSRDRIYVVWVKRGRTARALDLEMETTAWCSSCERTATARQAWKNGRTVGRYRSQWVWQCTTCRETVEPATTAAATIIDWDLPTPRIGDRARPLAKATRERILAGLIRHGWAPVTTAGAGNTHEATPGNRARPLTEPLPTQQATATTALATPPGFLFQTAHGGRSQPLEAPHPTVCASDDRWSLIVPMRRNGDARGTGQPVPTITAGGFHHGLLMRNNTPRQDAGYLSTPVTEPARAITTTGHQSLLVPYYSKGQAQTTARPVGTITTVDKWALTTAEAAEAAIDNCGFRMLEPHELAAAMAFPAGYIPTHLTKKDRVRLAGNAVTPPVMTWIVGRVAQALEVA